MRITFMVAGHELTGETLDSSIQAVDQQLKKLGLISVGNPEITRIVTLDDQRYFVMSMAVDNDRAVVLKGLFIYG